MERRIQYGNISLSFTWRGMAVPSRGRTVELPPRQWKGREASPERTKVLEEPKHGAAERKVPVVYYLSRNGHLEHPHFMEVSLSSTHGLCLRDVIDRLNFLRGKGMASMYSWSSKRSYKNGFVWHDLSEDDFIHQVNGHEYVLKGSELLHAGSPISQDNASATSGGSSSSSERPVEIPRSVRDDSDFSSGRRKKTPWCSLDLTEYRVYKAESTADTDANAADASTQTDDRRQWRRALIRDEQRRVDIPNPEVEENPSTELGRDEISPPPSSSSSDTLESLMKGDLRAGIGGVSLGVGGEIDDLDRTTAIYPSGRFRASAVLMHLISCGSISLKDHGFSLVSQCRARLPRGGWESSDQAAKDVDGVMDHPGFPAPAVEDKAHFSGSLIETEKASDGGGGFPTLKLSSSYNAHRCAERDLEKEELDGVRAKCMPRRLPKPPGGRKEGNKSSVVVSRSAHGSKRINDELPK